jgi:hypothetical protein
MYQVAWQLFFQYAPNSIWLDGSAEMIIVIKLISELCFYSVVLICGLLFTVVNQQLSKWFFAGLMLCLLGYTANGLLPYINPLSSGF